MNNKYLVSHTRLYSVKGGVVRFKYNTEHLLEAINAETQFTGRNIKLTDGQVDMDKMSGPDDIEFVIRHLKSAADTFDNFIPKHVKPSDISMVVYSAQEITISLAESGRTNKSMIHQVYEQIRSYLLNLMMQMWYQKSGVQAASDAFMTLAMLARQNIQRVLLHSFTAGRVHGTRYPLISLADLSRPLQGKFLGSYPTIDDMETVHGGAEEEADIVYIESEGDYMIYDGADWQTLEDEITGASSLNAVDGIDYPEADIGDMHNITKSGVIGEYKDRIYAGDALLCIRNNESDNFRNTLENFITIGSVRHTE